MPFAFCPKGGTIRRPGSRDKSRAIVDENGFGTGTVAADSVLLA
jgi:hypothetical protein